MTYSAQKIGELIKKERMEHHMSLEYIAEKCDVKQYQTVSSWEKGNTTPSLKQLFKLCEVFKCELGYLLGEEGYENKTRVKTDVHKEIGLSIKAIEHLSQLKRIATSKNMSWPKDIRQMICEQYFEFYSAFITDPSIIGILNIYGSQIGRIETEGLNENEKVVFGEEQNALDFYNYTLQKELGLFIEKYMKRIANED